MKLEEIDLRPITRGTDRSECRISLGGNLWITAGLVGLTKNGPHRGKVLLTSYCNPSFVDASHCTAYALRLPLIGMEVGFIHNSTSFYEAWIDPNDGGKFTSFNVPKPGYDPFKVKGTKLCDRDRCSTNSEHWIVPDGHFVPPFDPELYAAVKGREVEIAIGPVWGAKAGTKNVKR